MANFTSISNFNRKTLKQVVDQNIDYPKVREFVAKIAPATYEALEGGIIEFGSIGMVQDINFNKFAYLLNDTNFLSSGTGVQANNRQEVDSTWFQLYQWEMSDPYNDANIDYATVQYKNGEYADRLLDETFVNEGFSKLGLQLETLNAMRTIIGNNSDGYFHQVLPNGTDAVYSTLKSLIATAKTDTAITNVDDIVTVPTSISNSRHIDLSQSSYSDLEVFSQLNNLDNKMSNVNSVFGAGNTSSFAYVNKGHTASEMVWVCWGSLVQKIKAKNYQFYKQLEELFDENKLVILPETGVNLEYASRDGGNNGFAQSIAITPSSLGLDKDEIFLIDRNSWIAYEYPVNSGAEEQVTKNNITKTSFTKTQLCAVKDYLPSGSIAVVKVTQLTELDNGQLP